MYNCTLYTVQLFVSALAVTNSVFIGRYRLFFLISIFIFKNSLNFYPLYRSILIGMGFRPRFTNLGPRNFSTNIVSGIDFCKGFFFMNSTGWIQTVISITMLYKSFLSGWILFLRMKGINDFVEEQQQLIFRELISGKNQLINRHNGWE